MRRLIEALCLMVVRAYSLLPLAFHYAISGVAAFLLCHIVRYRRAVVEQNIEKAFPHLERRKKRRTVRKFYRHLCNLFAETAKGFTMDASELRSRFKVVNASLPQSYLASGRSVLLYGAHIGNWEWFVAVPQLFSRWAVAQAFYQRQRSSLANSIMLHLRSRDGIVPVESQRAFIHTAHTMREGRQTISLMLGDQRPRRMGRKIWTSFFDVETPFLAGPEMLAKRLGCVLLYPHIRCLRRGYYEVEFKLIAENPQDLPNNECAHRYAALLEDNIREQPSIWLWSHKKWKWNRSSANIRQE